MKPLVGESAVETRAEKVARAQALRGDGLLLREIAEQMGAKLKTVHSWLSDPDLARQRARRDGYRGRCRDCGAQTDGSAGPEKAPDYCSDCAPAAHAKWNRERIVEAAQEFARRYGRQPYATDWHVGHPHMTQGQRERFYSDGCWPHSKTVNDYCGSWNEMIMAAGFEPFDHKRDHDWGIGKLSARKRLPERVSA